MFRYMLMLKGLPFDYGRVLIKATGSSKNHSFIKTRTLVKTSNERFH